MGINPISSLCEASEYVDWIIREEITGPHQHAGQSAQMHLMATTARDGKSIAALNMTIASHSGTEDQA